MSTELVHVDANSHTFDLVPQAQTLAEQIARTDFVPDGLKNNPPAVMAAMLKGHEVGMAPMQALSHIHVIKGRPTISAEGQRALVLAAGHSIRVKALTPEKCTLVGTRSGESEGTEIVYTLAEAKKSGVARGNNWEKHPTDMLLARASTRLCRAVFADVIGGISSAEEVEDMDLDDPGPTSVKRKAPAKKAAAKVAPAEPKPEPELPPLPDEVDDIEEAEIVEDGPGITEPQKRKMMALFKEAGIDDRADRMAHVVEVVGRPLESSAELTKAEASKVIDDLVMITGGE